MADGLIGGVGNRRARMAFVECDDPGGLLVNLVRTEGCNSLLYLGHVLGIVNSIHDDLSNCRSATDRCEFGKCDC